MKYLHSTSSTPSGVIRTSGYLDHESVPGYVLTVRAQDHGEVPLSNTAYVQVNVTDVNDNPPVFMEKRYKGKVREDASIGSKVIQVGCSPTVHQNSRKKRCMGGVMVFWKVICLFFFET